MTHSASDNMLRAQVAACTLLLNNLKIMGYSGHVSARLPGRDAYLIQGFDQPRSGLRPEHLLICDYDGKMLSGPPGQRPPAEVFLHGEVLRARPDINSVAHFHHDITNVFTLVDGIDLLPLKNHAIRWVSGIPVHDDPSHVASSELGRAVADTLGSHHAMQIRAHGQIVTAESVPACLVDAVHFVENGEAMYHAAAIGKVRPLSDKDISAFQRDFKRVPHIKKLWKYYTEGGKSSGLLPEDWELGGE